MSAGTMRCCEKRKKKQLRTDLFAVIQKERKKGQSCMSSNTFSLKSDNLTDTNERIQEITEIIHY